MFLYIELRTHISICRHRWVYTLMAQLDDSDWGTYIMRANNHHRTHEHVCITHKQHARHTTAAHCATVPCSFLQLAFLLASSHIIMQTRVYIIAPVTISRKVPAQPRYAPPWSLTQTSVVTMAPACLLRLSPDLPVQSESAINVQLQRPQNFGSQNLTKNLWRPGRSEHGILEKIGPFCSVRNHRNLNVFVSSRVRTYSYIGSRLDISKVMLSSQWMAVANPHFPIDQWPICISFVATVDLVPLRQATLECRNAVDCFLGSIDAMHQILTDFAVYDAGPTHWKVPNFRGRHVVPPRYISHFCSNACPSMRYSNLDVQTPGMVWLYGQWVSASVFGLLGLQCEWMDGVAWGQFAEITSAVPCVVCGRPVYIPFCELNREILYSLSCCSTQLSVSLQTPDEVDDYMMAAKRGPQKFDSHGETLVFYALAAIWRDLAADGHVSDVDGYTHQSYHERMGARDRTERLQKDTDRVNLRKLWALWAVSMKALLKMNVRMRLLIGERHIVGDPQHAIQGRVMDDTESVVSVLTYHVDGVSDSAAAWQLTYPWQPVEPDSAAAWQPRMAWHYVV